MKKLLMLTLCVMLSSLLVQAQQKAEYNRKGDEAMSRMDYRDAKIWYEEGIASCDGYSIRQLTAIWLDNVDMRNSMHSVMIKCLNCLTLSANVNDTVAISQLITYYDKGIGVSKSDELKNFYKKQLEQLKSPAQREPVQLAELPVRRKVMTWLVGYASAKEAPYGVTVGGIWDKTGWYARFRTNFSFQGHNYECDDMANVIPLPVNASIQKKENGKARTNTYLGTAGFIYRMTTWLYGSLGLGYGERALLWPFISTDYSSGEKRDIWLYNTESSRRGVVVEADMMCRYKSYFVSIGCNTMNFGYVDLNAGIGMFF